MEIPVVNVSVGNISVSGKITERSRFYIEVLIIYPYKGWRDYRRITGRAKMTSNHYLMERGDEVAEQMLIDSYRKLNAIEKSWKRIVWMYEKAQEKVDAIKKQDMGEIGIGIIRTIVDRFYIGIFHSYEDLSVSHSDRQNIYGVMEDYRRTSAISFILDENESGQVNLSNKNPTKLIDYIDSNKIKIFTASLIIRVDHLNAAFGTIKFFLEGLSYYCMTNGRLLIFPEMHPGYLNELIKTIQGPIGLIVNVDFAICRQLPIYVDGGEISKLVEQEIPECLDVHWLGSIISEQGNYVWLNNDMVSQIEVPIQ